MVVFLFPLLLLGLTSETSLISKLVSSPPALWLGRVSYALYMSHAIAQKLIKILLPPEKYIHSSLNIRLLLLFANVLLILIIATGLYYAVEIPARNFLRRVTVAWSRRNQSPVPGI